VAAYRLTLTFSRFPSPATHAIVVAVAAAAWPLPLLKPGLAATLIYSIALFPYLKDGSIIGGAYNFDLYSGDGNNKWYGTQWWKDMCPGPFQSEEGEPQNRRISHGSSQSP